MRDKYLSLFLKGIDTTIGDDIHKRLISTTPLRVKFGADPSAPDLHLGHWVVLKKLKLLQQLGHQIIFLIGDFTARIGDPTGKSDTRKPLTEDQVVQNAQTYTAQVFKVLDPTKTEVVYNSTWLNTLTATDIIRLTATMTVARMLEREDFHNRYTNNRPIGLHEFLYPLLQGYDSVVLKSDLEMGGTDQTFNVLMGRHLQKEYDMPQQAVIVTPILEGLDGVQKMSKSLGNAIALTESATDMFGKLMSIPDSLIMRYFTLLTDRLPDELTQLQGRLDSGENPKLLKQELAADILTELHGRPAAEDAQAHFDRVFSQRQLPEVIDEVPVPTTPFRLDEWLIQNQVLPSKKEAHRLASQGAITLDETVISNLLEPLSVMTAAVLRVGKRKFFKLIPTPLET